MNTPPNAKLQLFVDSVMTYYAQLIVSFAQNVTVNYNPHNCVFWFVLSRDRALIENKFVESLEELDAIPRMVQIGWVDSTPDSPLLLVFFNERGVYTKGMPHTLPTASCPAHKAKEAAQTVFNYLTTGSFTGKLDYGVMRSLKERIITRLPSYSEQDVLSARAGLSRQASNLFELPKPRKLPGFFDSLNISEHLKKILCDNYIYSDHNLRRYTEDDLLKIKGIGPKRVEKIKAALAERGLKLKMKRKKKP